jgi:hypothetical protein
MYEALGADVTTSVLVGFETALITQGR